MRKPWENSSVRKAGAEGLILRGSISQCILGSTGTGKACCVSVQCACCGGIGPWGHFSSVWLQACVLDYWPSAGEQTAEPRVRGHDEDLNV